MNDLAPDLRRREHADEVAAAALTLARRFAADATLWCWAPGAPEHAQHVAVEFVHPVVMGTRALPAVALLDGDPVVALRTMARDGDVLVVIAAADDDPTVSGVLLRARAWGVSTIWLGWGLRPAPALADQLVWVGEGPDDVDVRDDGGLVLAYHLLWELTHVCFEHPGLLRSPAPALQVCTTCSDEGRLGEVVVAGPDDAEVRTAAGVERVSTLMIGPVRRGDLVLVHAGTAVTVVDG